MQFRNLNSHQIFGALTAVAGRLLSKYSWIWKIILAQALPKWELDVPAAGPESRKTELPQEEFAHAGT